MKFENTNDFKNIVLNNIPLIDTRAPIEFIKGAFETSVNLPIMTDDERHLVGICYKEKGNEEAVKLGHKLVSGNVKEDRLNAWKLFIEENPSSMIYCFRGGSRSTISQEWISTYLGMDIIKLEGGYKAFRNYLINELSPDAQTSKPIILAGLTGTGKTNLLKELENSIDLEGIANHRGSAFGARTTPQPTQINFENNLAYELIKHRDKGYSHVILEDEGGNVGVNFIPKPLAQHFKCGDLVIIESPLEDRVSITLEEYVINSQKEFISTYKSKELGLSEWFNYISGSITRVKKKIGGDRFKQIYTYFETAYETQINTGDLTLHKEWIRFFLSDYYDPMYQYQLDTNKNKVLFKGSYNEVLDFLKHLS